jgi:plasmid stability protein
MSNLQIKGIDDRLYQELKKRAADENRSISQQVLYLIRNHLATRRHPDRVETAAQTLISLAGSWEDARTGEEIVQDLRRSRRSSMKFGMGLP